MDRRGGSLLSPIEVGITIRNMGPQSTREMVQECALAAESLGLESLWITDHIAIPPDDAEGSEGRYLDPLATLAWLAGQTESIRLGTGVLVLPYRRPLATAKSVATVQELSGGRLLLGVGVGWMKAEFRASGVERAHRARDSDAVLDLLQRCFAAEDDVAVSEGQPFLFRPHPPKPPIFVGGVPPHAFARAIRYGDGWMPMGGTPDTLAPAISELRRRAAEAGKPVPQVVALGALPLEEPERALSLLNAHAECGVTRFVQGVRYADAEGFQKQAESLALLVEQRRAGEVGG